MRPPADDTALADEDPGAAEAAADSDGASDGTDDFFPSRKHHRQGSLMKEVRDRIERLPDIAPLQGKLDACTRRGTTQAAISASLSVPELGARRRPAAEPGCQVSFRTALACGVAAVVLLSCLGILVPFGISGTRCAGETPSARLAAREQLDSVRGFLDEASFVSVLAEVDASVWAQVQAPADGNVDQLMDLLWPYVFRQQSQGGNWSSSTCDADVMLTNGSWPLTTCAQSSGPVCTVWTQPGSAQGANCTSSPPWGRGGATDGGPSNLPADPTTSAAAERTWSRVWEADGSLRVSRLARLGRHGGPAAPRLDVAAALDLSALQRLCHAHLRGLRQRLGAAGRAPGTGARLFVVSRAPAQEGLLLGAAGAAPGPPGLVDAADAPDGAVRAAARALLQRFGSWGSAALGAGERSLDFGAACGAGAGAGPAAAAAAAAAAGCTRELARPLRLGGGPPWLAVLAVPAAAAPVGGAEGAEGPAPEGAGAWRVGLAALAGVALLCLALALGLGLGCLAARPLRRLDGLLHRLGDLDFSEAAGASLGTGIAEVGSLQRSFGQVSQAMEAFARFVPETVVRRIVRGDPRAARLHVSRREVTIMFSDIRDFTAISEALPECDLLFVLTRYLSVMTRIVEYFNGIVAEVLGDGLLVFWNTPDDVSDHPAKGCEAALAMQQAMVFLNAEFSRLKLPQLAIRVGLHTGRVLSGNLGSELKMKFGCLGDPINLASRLEGLCKFYGVGVICSGSTHDALPPEYGFFCRKLDLVQVKGKKEATWIYEVMGHEAHEGPVGACASASAFARARSAFCRASSTAALDAIHRSTLSLCRTASSVDLGPEAGGLEALEEGAAAPAAAPPGEAPLDLVTPERRALAELYEKALGAYQEARLAAARDLAGALLERHPGDAAAARLLERVRRHLGPDGRPSLTEAERASWTGVFAMLEK